MTSIEKGRMTPLEKKMLALLKEVLQVPEIHASERILIHAVIAEAEKQQAEEGKTLVPLTWRCECGALSKHKTLHNCSAGNWAVKKKWTQISQP